jgi:ectoine hydroxylase-related dioxygenase (phytanoyl-CoA dioxygenase family)
MQLTAQQKQFFDTFGYLIFPGLVKDQIETITSEFRGVFDDRGIQHNATKRTCMVPFIDQRAKLCGLLDNPDIHGIATGLLGDDFNYMGSDGNYYTGDTVWHSDGYHTIGRYMKIAFYLDPVTRETGALRVIPGSHRLEHGEWQALKARESEELWGIEQSQVPSVALESQPGDVVVFNHNLMHSAFGGNSQRRMFTINLCSRAQTPEEVANLRTYVGHHACFLIDHMYGETMLQTATAERMRHLEQIIANEDHLPALTAEARRVKSEAARG